MLLQRHACWFQGGRQENERRLVIARRCHTSRFSILDRCLLLDTWHFLKPSQKTSIEIDHTHLHTYCMYCTCTVPYACLDFHKNRSHRVSSTLLYPVCSYTFRSHYQFFQCLLTTATRNLNNRHKRMSFATVAKKPFC